jgi:hypothetical protein
LKAGINDRHFRTLGAAFCRAVAIGSISGTDQVEIVPDHFGSIAGLSRDAKPFVDAVNTGAKGLL